MRKSWQARGFVNMAKRVVPVQYVQQNFAVGANFCFEGGGKSFALQACSAVELERLLQASLAFSEVRELLGLQVKFVSKKTKRKKPGGLKKYAEKN